MKESERERTTWTAQCEERRERVRAGGEERVGVWKEKEERVDRHIDSGCVRAMCDACPEMQENTAIPGCAN